MSVRSGRAWTEISAQDPVLRGTIGCTVGGQLSPLLPMMVLDCTAVQYHSVLRTEHGDALPPSRVTRCHATRGRLAHPRRGIINTVCRFESLQAVAQMSQLRILRRVASCGIHRRTTRLLAPAVDEARRGNEDHQNRRCEVSVRGGIDQTLAGGAERVTAFGSSGRMFEMGHFPFQTAELSSRTRLTTVRRVSERCEKQILFSACLDTDPVCTYAFKSAGCLKCRRRYASAIYHTATNERISTCCLWPIGVPGF